MKHSNSEVKTTVGNSIDEVVYQQLKILARNLMKKERSGHTISPTELVHDAFLKLSNYNQEFKDEQHRFRTLARQMRRLLVDYARHKNSQKQKGAINKVMLTDSLDIVESVQPNFIHINDAIDSLKAIDERSAVVVEWVYFTGLDQHKVAKLLDVSLSTVQRDLKFGRAFVSDYVANVASI